MKVALKNIKPNPWRYLNDGYPINKLKVDKLRASIKRTGFWDNLIGRKKGEFIEIAYGHHRMEALRQEFKNDYEIDIVIRDFNDSDMLKIMAAENDALDVMSPYVINETVRAAQEFLKDDLEILRKNFNLQPGAPRLITANHPLRKYVDKAVKMKQPTAAILIGDFLDWPIERIKIALTALKSFEAEEMDKEEYESIPNQRLADEYRREVKKLGIKKSIREPIHKKLMNHEIGVTQVRKALLQAKNQTDKTGDTHKIMIDDVCKQISSHLMECSTLMTDNFINNADCLGEETVETLIQAVKMVREKLTKMKSKLTLPQIRA